MTVATFKTIPNYEYHRDGLYVTFNGEGMLVTNDEKVIEALSKCEPFIKRLEAEAKPEPKAQAKPKAAASTRRTTNK